MLARAFKRLREALPELKGVCSYCDPLPRYNRDGVLIKAGHLGTVYKSSNAVARGRSKPRTILLAPDGSVANERALSKLRNSESGALYVERKLREMGADMRRLSESGADYVTRLIDTGFLHRQKHPGNFVFTWQWT